MFSKKKFNVDFEEKQTHETAVVQSTALGRPPTTIATAKQYHKKQERVNPVPHIHDAIKKGENYYGQIFEDETKPFTIPKDEITHSIFIGSTGTGKGVLLGNRVYQSITEKRGVIIVDPKGDDFVPQIIAETLKKQNRPASDFKMVYFPNKWGYKAITDDDTYLEMANKLIDMFDFTPSDNPGVDYHRRNGRTLLRRLLKIFFISLDLGVYIKKDFNDIKKHIILLKEDLEKRKNYEKEMSKVRPNAELMEKFSKRYYDPKKIEEIYFADTDIATLDDLATKFQEVTEGLNFQADINIKDALYNGKVIYFKIDMNDIASLNWIKFLITDIIQKTKKRKANTDVYLDELSFYATSTLSGSLATTRSLGLNFNLFLQAISQLPDELKEDILENCNFKVFYKSSNLTTLSYINEIGGIEAVTKIAKSSMGQSYTQEFENYLNVTKIRAFKRTQQAIVIAECLFRPYIIQTNFIAVEHPFNWNIFRETEKEEYSKITADENLTVDFKSQKTKLEKYRVFLKEKKELLENSDLFGITLDSEKII